MVLCMIALLNDITDLTARSTYRDLVHMQG
jgi:hypothetical protein